MNDAPYKTQLAKVWKRTDCVITLDGNEIKNVHPVGVLNKLFLVAYWDGCTEIRDGNTTVRIEAEDVS